MKATLTINYTDGTEEDDIEVVFEEEHLSDIDLEAMLDWYAEDGKEVSSFVLVMGL